MWAQSCVEGGNLARQSSAATFNLSCAATMSRDVSVSQWRRDAVGSTAL
jgi:hypothetical protein